MTIIFATLSKFLPLLFCVCHATADYSVFPDEETMRCHRRDKAVFIGLIAACFGTVLVSAVIIGVVIVVCCYRLKPMKRSYHV